MGDGGAIRERLRSGEPVLLERPLGVGGTLGVLLCVLLLGLAGVALAATAVGLASDLPPLVEPWSRETALLTVYAGFCAGWFTLPGLSLRWIRRRFGPCVIQGDQLHVTPVAAPGSWHVDGRDVTGWTETSAGLLLAATRVRHVARREARPMSPVVRALVPLLVPTRDVAEHEAVIEHLAGRRAP